MGEMMEVCNAVIKSARITNDDHGCLSAWLTLDYGGSGQGFGGFVLYIPESFTHHKEQKTNYAGHFIYRVMEIAGVENWENLIGKTIRAKRCHSEIAEIGHIIKNDWFNPKAEFKKLESYHEKQ